MADPNIITVPMSRNRRVDVELLPNGFVRVQYTHEHKNKGGGSRWVTDDTVGKNLGQALRGALNRETLTAEMQQVKEYVEATRLGARLP